MFHAEMDSDRYIEIKKSMLTEVVMASVRGKRMFHK